MCCSPEHGTRRWPDARTEPVADLLCDLSSLERALHDPAVRRDRDRLRALLHPQFEEVGRSGRRYVLKEVLARLPLETDTAHDELIEARDFGIRVLGPDCVQLNYVSIEPSRGRTWRLSLWERSGGRWQLRYHQGTACG